jgi:hypothetical protein
VRRRWPVVALDAAPGTSSLLAAGEEVMAVPLSHIARPSGILTGHFDTRRTPAVTAAAPQYGRKPFELPEMHVFEATHGGGSCRRHEVIGRRQPGGRARRYLA